MTKKIDRSDVKTLTEVRKRPLIALLSGNAPDGSYFDTLLNTEEVWTEYDNDSKQELREDDCGIPRNRAFMIHKGVAHNYNVVTLFPEGHYLHAKYLERVAKREARRVTES